MKTKTVSSFFVLFAIVAGIGATTPAAFADHMEVTIEPVAGSGIPGCEDLDGCYTPSTATVDVGGKVIFSNTDVRSHTFTSFVDLSDTSTVGIEFGLTEGLLQTGESFEWVPKTAGEVTYFCMIHPWMQGLIIVQEAAAEEEEVMDETVEEETMMDETVEEETMMDETVEEETMMDETVEENGGCLIATATFGSELAPQVQQLRELRDNSLLNTESGTSFMKLFNDFYYSFSQSHNCKYWNSNIHSNI